MNGDDISTTAEAVERAALPQSRAVMTDPNAPATTEQQPPPASITRTPYDQKSAAEWAYERLILYIKNFEDQLDNEHEVAMGFAGSNSGVLRIQGIGFYAPDIVTFYGADENGTRTQLVQHVSQLNVMLRALPKPSEHEKPSRIGFRLVADLEQVAKAAPPDA